MPRYPLARGQGPGATMGEIEIWARPGSSADRIRWDRWRRRWTVSCRAPAVDGQANAAIRRLVAGWLGLPEDRIVWRHAGRGAAKRLEVEGIDPSEIDRRLANAAKSDPPTTGSSG